MAVLAFLAGWRTFRPAEAHGGGTGIGAAQASGGRASPMPENEAQERPDLAALIRDPDVPLIEKQLRIEDQILRDPGAAFALLRALPPLLLRDQRALEIRALYAWAERSPLAAYEAATDIPVTADGSWPDLLMVKAFQQNPAAGLAMLRSRVARDTHGMNPADHDWMDADPGKWCLEFAALQPTTACRMYLKEAATRWAKKDPQAVISAAGKLPADSKQVLLDGLLASMPPERAAAACAELGITGYPVRSIAIALADKNPTAAAEWLLTLPPADLEANTEIVVQRLAKSASQEELRSFAARLPPAGWEELAPALDDISRGKMLQAAPAWAVRGLLSRMGLHPGRFVDGGAPAWFRDLPESRAALVIREVSALAATGDNRNLVALSELPAPLAEAGALGAVRAVLDASATGSTATLDGLRYLPRSVHYHILRNLESLPGAPEHKLLVRKAIEH